MEAHRWWNLPRAARAVELAKELRLFGQVCNSSSCKLPPFFESLLNVDPPQSVCAHLLPWRWIPPSCHTVHWTGWTRPSVAGFFQVQVWFLNIAAPSLREGYQLALEGLLAAFHFPLPHPQTTASGTLGAKKRGVSVQAPPLRLLSGCVLT